MTNQSTIPNEAAIIYASFDQLYLHNLNPRQDVAQEDVETLAGSIKTCGLLQNLGGIQDDDGKIGIVSGGRRLRALAFLVETYPDFEGASSIPVLLARDLEQAEYWANAENTAREALDPADEVRAYGRMAATNTDAEAIASAFGVTVAHVKGRLKLANLPDAGLDALKAKNINLSAAQKMTTAQDEKLVHEALQAIAEGRLSNVNQLDHFLHPKAAKATDRRAMFVGVEAYEAGGGKITRDLFSEDVFFEDQDVLDEAFAAQLAEAAEQVRVSDCWAWVETHNEHYLGWNFIEDNKFARVYPVEGVLSDDQMERYEDLCEMADNDVLNAEGQDELAGLDVILEGDFTEGQKAHAGCVVYVDQSGGLKVEAGLIKPEDKKAALAAGVLQKSAHGSGDNKVPKNPYSQKLRDDLEAIKLAALQNAMLEQSSLLVDLLAFQLSGATGFRDVFEVSLGTPSNTPSVEAGFEIDKRLSKPGVSPADAWDVDLKKAFASFKKKGKKHRDAELTRHLAKLLTAGDAIFYGVLSDKAGADIRKVWTPTAENLFKRVSGPMLETIYCDLLDLAPTSAEAKVFAKLKKAEKAKTLEDLFSDETKQKLLGITSTQKARIEAWVPNYYD